MPAVDARRSTPLPRPEPPGGQDERPAATPDAGRAPLGGGDHPGDRAAPHAANAYAVGIATGANDEHDLEAAGADLALPDLDTFATWLPRHVSERSSARN